MCYLEAVRSTAFNILFVAAYYLPSINFNWSLDVTQR